MERYTIVFITKNAPYVLGGSSAYHQEFKTAVLVPDDGRRNRLKHVEHL
jgi:hypothetical protein